LSASGQRGKKKKDKKRRGTDGRLKPGVKFVQRGVSRRKETPGGLVDWGARRKGETE